MSDGERHGGAGSGTLLPSLCAPSRALWGARHSGCGRGSPYRSCPRLSVFVGYRVVLRSCVLPTLAAWSFCFRCLFVWAFSRPAGSRPRPSGFARWSAFALVSCAPLGRAPRPLSSGSLGRGPARPRTRGWVPRPFPLAPRSLRSRPSGFGRCCALGRAVAPAGLAVSMPAFRPFGAFSRHAPFGRYCPRQPRRGRFFISLRSVFRLPAADHFPLVVIARSRDAIPRGCPSVRPLYARAPCVRGSLFSQFCLSPCACVLPRYAWHLSSRVGVPCRFAASPTLVVSLGLGRLLPACWRPCGASLAIVFLP